MKAASICALLWLSSLALAGCDASGRAGADDTAAHQAVAQAKNGAEVTFHATVVSDPVESGGHERFEVTDPAGDRLEVDHNTSLAQAVPIHNGDQLVIHGELYVDPGPVYGVHCTHAHTSRGCPEAGWIEYQGNYYE
jgi:uncharacterized protein DUF3465